MRQQSLPGFPRFPEAFECEKNHHDGRQQNHDESPGPQVWTFNVSSVFLDRRQNEQDTQSQENSAYQLQPQLVKRPQKIGEDDFEFPAHGGLPLSLTATNVLSNN